MAWLKEHRPEVVIGFSVQQYWMIRDSGLKIPEDVGYASLHINGQDDAFCSGLIQNMEEIARHFRLTHSAFSVTCRPTAMSLRFVKRRAAPSSAGPTAMTDTFRMMTLSMVSAIASFTKFAEGHHRHGQSTSAFDRDVVRYCP